MSVWENIYHHATEELQSLLQRKNANPMNNLIDIQIKAVEREIEAAKMRLQ